MTKSLVPPASLPPADRPAASFFCQLIDSSVCHNGKGKSLYCKKGQFLPVGALPVFEKMTRSLVPPTSLPSADRRSASFFLSFVDSSTNG
ncbi:unnamed protein product [Caenorhabditis auriculariae]|uniref:Uncharacterized protein n=1 Tax=Caenorhabditis auriculariae TaxID=2777116 RepID=A0A8S1H3Z4_9PELO|nr:unnamed protein product [Caenorhabditis auriculariae]